MGVSVLQEERIKRGLPLHDVAEHVGVSDSTMRDWERTSGPIDSDIYKVLELSLLYERRDVGFFVDVLGEKYLKRIVEMVMMDSNTDYFRDREADFYEILERIMPVGATIHGTPMEFTRELAGYSKFKAAKELVVDKRTLTGYEEGEQIPSLETIIKMSELYDMSVEDIIGLYAYEYNKVSLRAKYKALRDMHPEIDSEKLRMYLKMTDEQFEECEKAPYRFPVLSIFKLANVFKVPDEYFRGLESRLEFDKRMQAGELELDKEKEREKPYLSFLKTASSVEGRGSNSQKDYIGFIRNEDNTIIFPVRNVYTNVEKLSVAFLDENSNAIVINYFNSDWDTIKIIDTGYNSKTFSLVVKAPVFPSREIREYEEGERHNEMDYYIYPTPIPGNNIARPQYGYGTDYNDVIFITFFIEKRFTDDYLFMKKTWVRSVEKPEKDEKQKKEDENKESYEIKLDTLKENIETFMDVNQIQKSEMAKLLKMNSSTLSNFLKHDASPKNLEAFLSLKFLTKHSIDELLTKRLNMERRNYHRNLGVNTLFYGLSDCGIYAFILFILSIEAVLCLAKSFSITMNKIPKDTVYPNEDGMRKYNIVDIKIKNDAIEFVTDRYSKIAINTEEYRIRHGLTRYNSLYTVSFLDWYDTYGFSYDLIFEIEYPLGEQKRDRIFSLLD